MKRSLVHRYTSIKSEETCLVHKNIPYLLSIKRASLQIFYARFLPLIFLLAEKTIMLLRVNAAMNINE